MNKTLKTKQLEFDKSSFLIDLIQHDTGKMYVEISQHIFNDQKTKQTLKINPTIIPDLVKALEDFYTQTPNSKPIERKKQKFIPQSDKEKIQNRYLKGVPLGDLAIQFDISQENIKMILRNNEIVVLTKKEEATIKRGGNWYRKRKK
jgi:hypothetical protein